MKKFLIPIALLLIIGSIFAGAQMFNSKTNEEKVRSVTVTGSYNLDIAPDKAIFSASVETLKPTAKEAVDANREIMNKMISALKSAGLKDSEIQTQNFYVYKKEEYQYPDKTNTIPQPGKSIVVGFVATNTVTITTTSLDKVGSLIDIASNAGATGFNGVQFTLTDEKKKSLETDLLKGAALNAKDKAKTLAQSLDASLGKVMTISESSPIYIPYYAKNAGVMDSAATPIEPGQITTSTSVSVTFELN